MPRKSKNNKAGLTGYRLHLKRLEYSGASLVRAAKFPLGVYNKVDKKVVLTDPEKDLATKIKSDYESLWGSVNLSTYRDSGGSLYSFKDFWLDCLREGVIMMTSATALANTVWTITDEIADKDNELLDNIKAKNKKFAQAINSEDNFQKMKKALILTDRPRITQGEDVKAKLKKRLDFLENMPRLQDAIIHCIVSNKVLAKSRDQKDGWDEYWDNRFGVSRKIYGKPDITFFMLPMPSMRSVKEPAEVLLKMQEYLIANKVDGKIEYYIGIKDSANGLDHWFGKLFISLHQNDLDQIKNQFSCITSKLWSSNSLQKDLHERLMFLAHQAQKLPKQPALMNGFTRGLPEKTEYSWKNYRSNFEAQIASWFSNNLKRHAEIQGYLFGAFQFDKNTKKIKQVDGHCHQLRQIFSDLQELPFCRSQGLGKISEIQEIINNMQKTLENIAVAHDGLEGVPPHEVYSKRHLDIPYLEEYKKLLKRLKSNLTYLFQELYGDLDGDSLSKRERKKKIAKYKYPLVFRELPELHSFVGYSKTRGIEEGDKEDGYYAKYLSSVGRARRGIELLITLSKLDYPKLPSQDAEDEKDRILKALQGLLRLKDRVRQTTRAKQIIDTTLGVFVDADNLLKLQPYDYIYRAKQSREKRGREVVLRCQHSELVNKLDNILERTKIDWSKSWNLKKESQKTLLEWIALLEIEKIRFGLMSRYYKLGEICKLLLDDNLRRNFPIIDIVFDRYKKSGRCTNEAINAVMQQAIFSELRGTFVRMTIEKMKTRYVVQPIKIHAKKCMPIVTEISEYGKHRRRGQNYYLYHPDAHSKAGSTEGVEMSILGKPLYGNNLRSMCCNKDRLIKLNSSKYQLQFLDNALSGKWEKYKPALSEYSLILEDTYDIAWSESGLSMRKSESRLFVSIPFKFQCEIREEARQEGDSSCTKFLGIDIGEYGVAMYLLDGENFSSRMPKMSFIYEESMARIREGIQLNAQRQKAGVFSSPNTRLKGLRDNAVTKIRNRIHAQVLRYGAKPVYEREVSALESGSGKISRIYHSIQKADVKRGKSAADELIRKLVWGKLEGLGSAVSAYATSYCCSHCRNSIYQYADYSTDSQDSESRKYTVKVKSSKLSQYKNCFDIEATMSDNRVVKGYLEGKNLKLSQDKRLDVKDLVRAVRQYARPPLRVILQHCKPISRDLGIKHNDYEKVAGSQSIFRCPFKNCESFADADLQAAMWVALKGYLDFQASKQDNKDALITRWDKAANPREKIKCLLDFAEEVDIQPISFYVDKRLSKV